MTKVGAVIVGLAFTGSVYGIAHLQPPLAKEVHEIKENDDIYLFPPPNLLKALSLGYEAALTDLLWAKLLTDYGTHWAEHRAFPDLPRYADAILALEPDFDALFRYIDTLIAFRPPVGTADDARLAVKYLERGVKARPYDPKVWMTLGEFESYIGPSFLDAESEKEQWRTEGARAIARAVELGGDANRALSAASVLSRSGERTASIRSLTRAYALTDDPNERAQMAAKLARLEADSTAETAQRAIQRVEGEWRRELPFVSRTMYLLVGPARNPFACEGEREGSPDCALDWSGQIGHVALPAD